MNQNNTPSVGFYIPAAIILSIGGWGGLLAVIYYTLPTLGPRWLFFFLLVLGVSGLVLPISAYLNRRFPSKPPATVFTVIREALLVAFFAAALIWLQIGRVLTPALVILFGLSIGGVELLIRLRERSRWNP
ncbi:MAG: hypothetical protein HN413_12040 [Chloroflexi bacterium]|jgi:hypothetical protein|nr:hypothetical protein [Chloroflexota bacterium]